ncbi:MAG: hypothetical protein RL033_2863, partial [Pseudomonadota bacterium]
MAISLSKYVQQPLAESTEWVHVSGLADELHRHLSTEDALTLIREANQPGQSSAV